MVSLLICVTSTLLYALCVQTGDEFERTFVKGLSRSRLWTASRRVKACHRRMVTSTYLGSSSSPYARRPTRSAANTVVPEPQKVSSTISRRRVQSFIASATNATGLTRRVRRELVHPAGPEAIHAGVVPDVRARAAVAPEFDIIEVRRLADPKHADELMLAAIEASLAGVRLDPHRQIQHLAIGLFAGLDQLAQVSPIHADIMERSLAGMSCRVAEGLDQKSNEFLSRHFARSHGEFAMLGAATPHHAPDLHVVGRVEKRHRRLLVAKQTIQVRRLACIST